MQTSFGHQATKLYRLHITCPAKHTTYRDYANMRDAKRNLLKMNDVTDWHATNIEVIS